MKKLSSLSDLKSLINPSELPPEIVKPLKAKPIIKQYLEAHYSKKGRAAENFSPCNNDKLLLLGDIHKESDIYKLLIKFINNIEIMDFIAINKSKTKNMDNNSKVDYLLI